MWSKILCAKLKATASIQGEVVRVGSAKKDVLREAIALVRANAKDLPPCLSEVPRLNSAAILTSLTILTKLPEKEGRNWR